MSTLVSYNDLLVVSPDPTGSGGLAINNNFKTLSNDVNACLKLTGGTLSGAVTLNGAITCNANLTMSGFNLIFANQIAIANIYELAGSGITLHNPTRIWSTLAAGDTTVNTLILTPIGAPSSPTAGQIYFDSTSSHFYGWNGSAWKQLDN